MEERGVSREREGKLERTGGVVSPRLSTFSFSRSDKKTNPIPCNPVDASISTKN